MSKTTGSEFVPKDTLEALQEAWGDLEREGHLSFARCDGETNTYSRLTDQNLRQVVRSHVMSKQFLEHKGKEPPAPTSPRQPVSAEPISPLGIRPFEECVHAVAESSYLLAVRRNHDSMTPAMRVKTIADSIRHLAKTFVAEAYRSASLPVTPEHVRDKDWDALVREIAKLSDDPDWHDADDKDLREAFDPWEVLRKLQAERASLPVQQAQPPSDLPPPMVSKGVECGHPDCPCTGGWKHHPDDLARERAAPSTLPASSPAVQALESQPQVTQEFLEAVEDEVGMGCGAWDCVKGQDICRAVLKVAKGAPPVESLSKGPEE